MKPNRFRTTFDWGEIMIRTRPTSGTPTGHAYSSIKNLKIIHMENPCRADIEI